MLVTVTALLFCECMFCYQGKLGSLPGTHKTLRVWLTGVPTVLNVVTSATLGVFDSGCSGRCIVDWEDHMPSTKCLYFIPLFLFLSMSRLAFSGVKETLEHIDALTKEGRKVAVLSIDMQKNSYNHFMGYENYKGIIKNQVELLEAVKDKDSVYVVGISNNSLGEHLDSLSQVMGKAKYQNYIKRPIEGTSAFHVYETIEFDPEIKADGREDPDILAAPEYPERISNDIEVYDVITSKLDNYLESNGIQDVVVTGCFDDGAVYRTAVKGANKGYNMVVDRDLTLLHDKRNYSDPELEAYDGTVFHWESEPDMVKKRELKANKAWNELENKNTNLKLIKKTSSEACQ